MATTTAPNYEVKFPSNEFILDESSTIIYGDSGIGKTTIAKTMPNALFLFMRGGGEHRPMPLIGSNIPYIEFFTKAQLDQFILSACREGLPKLTIIKQATTLPEAIAVTATGFVDEYIPKTLVFDQLTSMYSLILDDIMKNVVRARPSPDLPGQPDYGQGHKRFLNILFDINSIPNVHKVYLALAELDEDENTKERYGAPMIPGKMAKEVFKFADFVFHMHNRREMKDGKLREFRAFRTQPEGPWMAKDSSGRLPKIIELPSPTFDFWNEVVVKCLS